jgi:hypothetical protein
MRDRDSTPAERLNMAFKFGKMGRASKSVHEGEIFDIRQLSRSGQMRISNRKLFRERVAPCLGIANVCRDQRWAAP